MIGETNSTSVIEVAEQMHMEYKEMYRSLVYNKRMLRVSRKIGDLLQSEIQENTIHPATCPDTEAGYLIAHNLNGRVLETERTVQSAVLTIEDLGHDIAKKLGQAHEHYLENNEAYTEHARSLAGEAGVAIVCSPDERSTSQVA